ncbi:glycine--tRNA ligase subunit beta [Geobacter pelophilus]|uniref:Glycine--tRNA ligase beta subunit n=1 Tax=Geoanaerobacter pelophilus TaxID=60036 RepID=A0AAW4KYD1_9BACT|nr:glycine--tRNA ligase subunit beta [Geoanaerobacter pelophilus]MBT0663374.1 glycine--tRNA ligase subunit beta [Geoanaerobacter pelophilus]
MARELFLEIGTEEIPAGFLPKAMADMDALIRRELDNARLEFAEIKTLATPRRLALCVKGIPAVQPDAETTAMGPAKNIAFGPDGKPSKAAEGFARGQGVDVSDLQLIATDKGEYVAAVKKETGRPSHELMAEILPRLMSGISFRKSMHWGDFDVRFARPIHWIVALFDGVVVPFSFGPIESGSVSRGHRFMANTPFPVRDFNHYLEECERHFVIPDPAVRKEIIRRETHRVAKVAGGQLLPDEGLLEEVTYLVEYPSVVHGTFSQDFLAVPKEVLVTSMRSHQRYFSIVDDNGRLMPGFITINNTLTEDPTVVVKGNERVLRARLSDARFFFEEDRKVKLESRVESLKSVVYQQKLGTSYEKMERFKALAEGLADKFNPALKAKVGRAAYLCKADLVSAMVGEFPEVQGIMGREYALHDGEDADVASAIAEHYLPTQAGGDLPTSDIGAFVSLADKMDTICGCFGVGLIPTGSADPYALRRAALGIINIILEKEYRESLNGFVKASLDLLEPKLTRKREEVHADVLEFFKGRFVNLMADRYPSDVVDAVVAVGCDDLVDAAARIAALAAFKGRDDFEPLAVAFKRVCNIVKDGVDAGVDAALFQDPVEGALNDAFAGVKAKVAAAVAKQEYVAALADIATLRPPVDAFFDKVMVMAEDERVRTNRLALLTGIARLFGGIADFSRIAA